MKRIKFQPPSAIASVLLVLGVSSSCASPDEVGIATTDHSVGTTEARGVVRVDPGAPNSEPGSTTTGCTGRLLEVNTVVDSDVVDDATWSGVVRLSEPITVRAGATLTVAAGTEVVASEGAGLRVADAARLVVDGKASAVTFCGELEDGMSPGAAWSGIHLEEDADRDSTLAGLIVMDAGSAALPALLLSGPATLDGVQVIGAKGDGVRAMAFGEGSTALSVLASAGTGLLLADEDALASVPEVVELAGNGDDRIWLTFSELTQDVVVQAREVAWLQAADLRVFGGAELALEAGVAYTLAEGRRLVIGWDDEPAAIHARGTADAPVVFAGDGSARFAGLVIDDAVDTASTLEHVVIQGAGANEVPPLELRAPIDLIDVTVRDVAGAVYVGSAGFGPRSRDLAITASDGAPLRLVPNALVSLPSGTFTGNAEDHIEVTGGIFSRAGEIADPGVPYFVTGHIYTVEDSLFHASAGTRFMMDADARFEFGASGEAATVVIEGTSERPVVFTGAEESAGYWVGLSVGSNVTADSAITHAEVAHAGRGDRAALRLETAIEMTDAWFHDWGGAALIAPADSLEAYAASNTFTGAGPGDLVPLEEEEASPSPTDAGGVTRPLEWRESVRPCSSDSCR